MKKLSFLPVADSKFQVHFSFLSVIIPIIHLIANVKVVFHLSELQSVSEKKNTFGFFDEIIRGMHHVK